jgi:hypothetical protein
VPSRSDIAFIVRNASQLAGMFIVFPPLIEICPPVSRKIEPRFKAGAVKPSPEFAAISISHIYKFSSGVGENVMMMLLYMKKDRYLLDSLKPDHLYQAQQKSYSHATVLL